MGNHISEDIIWIKHKCAERNYKQTYNSGYIEVHDSTQTTFNKSPWELV